MGIQSDIADLAELKRLAEAIHGKGTTVEMLNRWALFEAACKPQLILALIAENERLSRFEEAYSVWNEKTEWVQESAKTPELGQHRADVLRSRIDQLKAEIESLRSAVNFAADTFGKITSSDGSGHADLSRAVLRIAGGAIAGDAELRKDADRYRWFRNHSLQIVHASAGPWVHNLDKVIDEAMAAADVFDTPLLCRQRMAASGLPHPRSSCYSCGQFSPKWRDCDALIAARMKEGK
jgi:hypothetical protein